MRTGLIEPFGTRRQNGLYRPAVGWLGYLPEARSTPATPAQIEDRLRHVAIAKVEGAADVLRAEGSVGHIAGSRTEWLLALFLRLGLQADAVDAQRKDIMPAMLTLAKSKSCRENGDSRSVDAQVTQPEGIERAVRLEMGQGTLGDFVVERCETLIHGPWTDLRRAREVNVIVLPLMPGLAMFRNRLNRRFAAVSVALTGYAARAAYGDVFNQNRALSILLQTWASPGDQAAMSFVALLFFDWLFLRGQVTETVGNLIASGLPGWIRCARQPRPAARLGCPESRPVERRAGARPWR